jgi:peptide-methionine (R)-S-oxide reductase
VVADLPGGGRDGLRMREGRILEVAASFGAIEFSDLGSRVEPGSPWTPPVAGTPDALAGRRPRPGLILFHFFFCCASSAMVRAVARVMSRRDILGTLLGAIGLGAGRRAAAGAAASTAADFQPLALPRDEWRKRLPPDAYAVLFEEGTEAPRSSPLDREKRAGTYVCAACGLPLFESSAKFESGTGWPSFFRAIDGRVATRRDFKLILPRTEYHCARCGGHQGHVFEDGPPPTGLRYCNNGVALRFVPEGEPLPALAER